MFDLDEIWHRHTDPLGLGETRPDFRFDAEYYMNRHPELVEKGVNAAEHYYGHGKKEGRFGTLYHQIKQARPNVDSLIANVLTDPELKEAVESEQDGAAELAFGLMVLSNGIDEKISDFSMRHYQLQYPDTKAAGIPAFAHYLMFGLKEKRVTLRTIRRNFYQGEVPYDPGKKTIILTVHEFTTTGAPIVALDVLKEANKTHNVIVLSLQAGALLEQFRRESMCVFVTFMPHEEIDFVLADHLPHVEYALLNSTDSSPYVKMLVPRGIPFAVYVHEFTQYSLPLNKTMWPSIYADYMIFSSDTVRESWRGIQEDLGFDTDRCTTIIPQAELRPGRISPEAHAKARKRIETILGFELGNRKLIYGAGSTHWRKGTDLFILMSQIGKDIDPDAVWVWIGDGMNHEDFHCGVWLEKQMVEAGVNRKDGYFHYIPSGDYYRDLCMASDVMILPSRMDPLPNVILDATKYDCEVVMFQNASGFDDEAYNDEPQFHKVGYGRVDEAARVATEQPRKMEKTQNRRVVNSDDGDETLFSRINTAVVDHLYTQKRFYLGTGDYDLPVLFTERDEDKPYRQAERQKVWSLGRKTVWKSDREAVNALQTSDHPAHRSGSIVRFEAHADHELPPFSIHIHAFYTDDLYHDINRYEVYRRANRIVITTDMVKKANSIHEITKSLGIEAEIVQVPNTGRDILPFMELFHDIDRFGGDDIWAHVHQKKSFASTPGGDVWRNFLLRILFGGQDAISNALLQMKDPDVGLVAPFDPFICGWFGSKRILPIYQQLVQTPLPTHPIMFPAGNMFFTRRRVVDQMNSYFGDDYPWPKEPIANDGTVFHMIERLWPTATYEAGLKSVFVSKPDQPRR
ncbi:MAG: rhamnan synthesis F family protein [Sulfitobacter sp.]|uniref:rhamnan synthesis F family protein n=1 Tax=Sulfitobacter sp. TaxID=1903071 RepID=UPI004059DC9B